MKAVVYLDIQLGDGSVCPSNSQVDSLKNTVRQAIKNRLGVTEGVLVMVDVRFGTTGISNDHIHRHDTGYS